MNFILSYLTVRVSSIRCYSIELKLKHILHQQNTVGKLSIFKIFHLFGIIAKIYYYRIAKNAKTLYYPPAGPDKVPIIRDIIILITTKWLFKKVIFHFHAGGVSEYKTGSAFFSFLYRKAYYNADCAILLSELNPADGKNMQAKKEVIIPYGIEDSFSQITDVKVNGPMVKILFHQLICL